MRIHTKNRGDSPQGWMPKRVLFLSQYNADFRSLILHRFWPLLKQKTWIGVRMRTVVKNFRISVQRILQVPKQLKFWVLLRGCLWWGYNSNGTISSNRIRGAIVDIPSMCLLWVSFGGGRTVWALYVHECNKFRRNFKFRMYKIKNFNVTRQGATHSLRAYITPDIKRCDTVNYHLWLQVPPHQLAEPRRRLPLVCLSTKHCENWY